MVSAHRYGRLLVTTALVLLLPGCPSDNIISPKSIRADLQVSKSDNADPVLAGGLVTYSLVVTNNGPDYAALVELQDVIEGGGQFVSHQVLTGEGTCTFPTSVSAKCTFRNLEAGSTIQIEFDVRAQEEEGQVVNRATATGYPLLHLFDGVPTYDMAHPVDEDSDVETTTIVKPVLDFTVVKRSDKAALELGTGDFLFEIEITNTGDIPIHRLEVSDPHSGSFILDPTELPDVECAVDGTSIECEFDRAADPWEKEDKVILRYRATPTQAGVFTNIATVTANATNGTGGLTKSGSRQVTVTSPPLWFTYHITTQPTTGTINTPINVLLDAQNTGTVDITKLTASFTLPAGLTVVPGSLSAGCTITASGPTCTRTNVIPVGGSYAPPTLFAVQATQAQHYTMPVTVTANDAATPPAPPVTIVVTPPAVPPAFTAEKVGAPASVEVGQKVQFVVNVVNTGTVPITHIEITDAVPASFTVELLTSDCTLQPGNVVKCAIDRSSNPILPSSGPVVSVGWLLYRVTATQIGTFVNTAAVTANHATTVNVVEETTVIGPTFTAEKVGGPSVVQVGQQVAFTISVVNTGTVPITHIEITDAVPASFIVQLRPGNGCTLQPGNIVKCSIDRSSNPILPSSGPVVSIGWYLYDVTTTQIGTFVNTAAVTANRVVTVNVVEETQVTAQQSAVDPRILLLNQYGFFAGAASEAGPLANPLELVALGFSAPNEGEYRIAPAPIPGAQLGGRVGGRLASRQTVAAIGEATLPVYIVYSGSKHILRWDLDATGTFSQGPSFAFGPTPFHAGLNRQGTCLAVPLQSNGTVQQLTSDLTSAGLLSIPGSFPTQVLFNPAHDVAYVADGTKLVVVTANPATCALTLTGTAPSYANRRHTAVDPTGEFLHVLTYNLFGATSTLVLQRLSNGTPTGTPTTMALPSGANQVIPHPTLDVVYVVQDAPNAGVRKVTFDRAAGTYTVGSLFVGGVPDELAFLPDASRLYYTETTNFDKGRICWVDLSPTGDLTGSATCQTEVPVRGRIDSDLLIVPVPAAAALRSAPRRLPPGGS